MKFLYNFGMSQDDAETERKALDLQERRRLVCIASAGDTALNLLAVSSVSIDAVDLSSAQLSLVKLKMAAALLLEPGEAARFLGFLPGPAAERAKLFQRLSGSLDGPEKGFWERSPLAWEKGPVHAARYERYLSRFSGIALRVLGRKKLLRLFECPDVEAQRRHFDERLASKRLKGIFRIAFHPKIYKKRGMDSGGLVHSRERNIAEFFFGRFRNFCTSTPARKNGFLQMTFFNRVLFDEALPEYLQESGNRRLRAGAERLAFHHESLSDLIRRMPTGHYDAFALSNVGDWMSKEDFAALMELIGARAAGRSRALLRFIHFAHPVPGSVAGIIAPDPKLGEELEAVDRYPFYGLIPMSVSGRS
jgi:S-adenosylmethionine-diacylglycerol 3-amino-3-carboxypropyl transferase